LDFVGKRSGPATRFVWRQECVALLKAEKVGERPVCPPIPYDNNGSTLTKTDSTGTTSYTWDFENRLSQVTLPSSGGTVSFKYDPMGRRIQKSTAATATNYFYDGLSLIEEVDAAGNQLARYTQGKGEDEPLAEQRSGTTGYYEQDGLTSVTSLSNSAGTISDTYMYDTFGNLTASTGPLGNPLQYTGREYDPETRLLFYRARYYDPRFGRFLSQDPIGFAGSGTNHYAYVYNDPANMVDPFGLATCIFYVGQGRLFCTSWRPGVPDLDIPVASGNNGGHSKCKNNSGCQDRPNRGPIPEGWWVWTNEATGKPNGRVLEPLEGTETFDRDLFRTHSCTNAFGPSANPPFCSEGCITGSPDNIKKLNKLIDTEPGSWLYVAPSPPVISR